MFENSIAFTVSASREGHWRLQEFCEYASFKKVITYQNTHVMTQQLGAFLPFCVVDDTTPISSIKETIQDIRACAEVDVSCMPIMLLTSVAKQSFIAHCIALGCDDILKLPLRTTEFALRAKLQMDTPREYFRTDTYFGPDRRRGNAQVDHPDRRDGVGFAFEKYLIRRNRRTGVKILSHEKFAADDAMAAFA